MPQVSGFDRATERVIPVNVASDGTLITSGSMAIPAHDSQVLAYTGSVLNTITYKLAGVTVATETLTYTDGKLTGVSI